MWIRGLPSPWSGKSKRQRCLPFSRSSHLSGAGDCAGRAARDRGIAEPAVRAAAAAATRARKPRRGVETEEDIGALGMGSAPYNSVNGQQSTVNGNCPPREDPLDGVGPVDCWPLTVDAAPTRCLLTVVGDPPPSWRLARHP